MFTGHEEGYKGFVLQPESSTATIYSILDNGTITGQYKTSSRQTLTGDYIYVDDDHIYFKVESGYYVWQKLDGTSDWIRATVNTDKNNTSRDNKIMWILVGIAAAATIYLITKNDYICTANI